MKTVIVGLGNPILGDDGVGWCVAEKVKSEMISHPVPILEGEERNVDVECLSLGGVSLMEHLIGYECAILIDAIQSEEEAGSIRVARLDQLPNYSAFHITSAHDTSLQNAITLGRELGAQLPDDVVVVGISTTHVYDFSEELSPPVAEAVPKAAQIVVELAMQKITIH